MENDGFACAEVLEQGLAASRNVLVCYAVVLCTQKSWSQSGGSGCWLSEEFVG